jgi:hypothetical protein
LALIVEKKPTVYSHHESEKSEPQHLSEKKEGEANDDSEQIDLEECIANAGSLR